MSRLINPEARLAPEVQVSDHLHLVRKLQVSRFVPVTTITAAASRQRPRDFKAVAIALAVVSGDGQVGRQVNVDGDGGHGRPSWPGSQFRVPVRFCPTPLLSLYNHRQVRK